MNTTPTPAYGDPLRVAFVTGQAAHLAGVPGVQDVAGLAYIVVSGQDARDDGETAWLVYDLTHGEVVWVDDELDGPQMAAYEELARAASTVWDLAG